MMVTFVASDPCGLCGYVRKGVMLPAMRINKRSWPELALEESAPSTPGGGG